MQAVIQEPTRQNTQDTSLEHNTFKMQDTSNKTAHKNKENALLVMLRIEFERRRTPGYKTPSGSL